MLLLFRRYKVELGQRLSLVESIVLPQNGTIKHREEERGEEVVVGDGEFSPTAAQSVRERWGGGIERGEEVDSRGSDEVAGGGTGYPGGFEGNHSTVASGNPAATANGNVQHVNPPGQDDEIRSQLQHHQPPQASGVVSGGGRAPPPAAAEQDKHETAAEVHMLEEDSNPSAKTTTTPLTLSSPSHSQNKSIPSGGGPESKITNGDQFYSLPNSLTAGGRQAVSPKESKTLGRYPDTTTSLNGNSQEQTGQVEPMKRKKKTGVPKDPINLNRHSAEASPGSTNTTSAAAAAAAIAQLEQKRPISEDVHTKMDEAKPLLTARYHSDDITQRKHGQETGGQSSTSSLIQGPYQKRHSQSNTLNDTEQSDV